MSYTPSDSITVADSNVKEKASISSLGSGGNSSAEVTTPTEKGVTTEGVLPSMMNSSPMTFDEGGLQAWLTILGALVIIY